MDPILAVSSLLLWVLVLFNLTLSIALARRLGERSRVPVHGLGVLENGRKVPSFEARTLDGNNVGLESFLGQATAFVFVSTTCNGCRDVPDALGELEHEAEVSGLRLALVSAATLEETRSFLGDRKLRSPVLIAPGESNSFLADYRVPGTPFYYLVDADGKVRNSNFFSKEYFRQEWRVMEARGVIGHPEGFTDPASEARPQKKGGESRPEIQSARMRPEFETAS